MANIISQTLRTWMQEICMMGILQNSNKEDARRIKVVNIVSLVTGILVAIYGVTFYLLLHSLYILIPAVLLFCPAFFAMIWLNYKKHFIASRIGLHAIFISIILYYGSILGRVTEVQLLAVFLMSVALLIWRPQEKIPRFICALMPIICLVLLEFIYYYDLVEPLPLTETTQNLYRWMVMPVVLFLNYLAISLYQHNIMDLLRTLRSRNTSLMKSRNENEKQRKQLLVYSQHLEQLVEERTSALNKANVAKSQFISELSHEIRTPLHAIIGISEMLSNVLSNAEAADPQARQMAKSLGATSNNIMELINNVLELSKIEAGKNDDVKLEPFSLKEWLQNTVSIYQSIASTKSVVLHLEMDSRFPETIMSDKVMLAQVINNVLSNSIKFTPAEKDIRIKCLHNSNSILIQICDQGNGISLTQQEAIFRPFEQGDKEVYRQYGGSGLGLAIAKRKAELLGGNIQVSSVPGEGSNFLITLPLKLSTDTDNGQSSSTALLPLPADTKVVVMDDNEIDHMIMKHFLARIGITQVSFAHDGAEGVMMARSVMPDVILMDLHMPVMSGRETFCTLREDEQLKHIPIVAVSSDAFKEQEQEFILLGMDGYIRKPVDTRVLHAILQKLLLYGTKHLNAGINGTVVDKVDEAIA
ncbi:ATP-binding protein [Chitinophaga niabensis]|uniref:ATP-binding protein n=1 Tax=Chitinophaga niabensis TaxID=536979 RepID=UPI0031BAE2CE